MSAPRLLFDENFNADVIEALRVRVPTAELATAQEQGLRNKPDDFVLAWAGNRGIIVVTHDVRTMPRLAWERVAQAAPMPGLILIPQRVAIGAAVEALELVAGASEAEEWTDRVVFLPM